MSPFVYHAEAIGFAIEIEHHLEFELFVGHIDKVFVERV